MKILPPNKRKNGYDFTLVLRGTKSCIYEQRVSETESHFEVFLFKTRGERIIANKTFEAEEIFPHNEAFGYWAWTYRSFEEAQKKFIEIEKNGIMIDFIKVDVTQYREELLNNSLLDFASPVSLETGEILTKLDITGQKLYDKNGNAINHDKIAKYNNLVFTIKPSGRVFMSGSIHKYFNIVRGDGNQNYNDFPFTGILSVLKEIQEKFIPNLKNVNMIKLEFGVNLLFPLNPRDYIKDRILLHEGDFPTRIQTVFFNDVGFEVSGYLKEFKKSKLKVKVYDKGLMYKLNENTLRFEVNSLSKYLNNQRVNIVTLNDLSNAENYNQLGNILIKQFEKLFIRDDCRDVDLNNYERKILKILRDESNLRSFKLFRRYRYNYLCKKYLMICNSYDKPSPADISSMIKVKWNQLLHSI